MARTDYDSIVVGGGSAGLSYARTAARLGARICLIERDRIGGTCVNRGCVPKKMLWTLARTMDDLRRLTAAGVTNGVPGLDLAQVDRRRSAAIEDIVTSYEADLAAAGIDRRTGDAVLTAPGEVTVGDDTLHADTIVLATGGHPVRADIPGADLCVTSREALFWTDVPARLVVVGGGYIGCELSAIWRALGSEVTLVSDTDAVLTEFSSGAQPVAAANLRAQGVVLHLGTRPVSVARDGTTLTVALEDGHTLDATHVLLAIGRAPTLAVLGDLADRITLRDSGVIRTSDNFATSMDGVYAIGDCADRLPLTPVAVADGRVLAQQLHGAGGVRVDLNHVATAAFVLPPVGEVGDRDTLHGGHESDPLSGPLRDPGETDYWALGTQSQRLSAMSIVADGAHEAIGVAAQLIAVGHPLSVMPRALPVHPSTTEAPLTAPADADPET